jgi:hypothetical protein
MSAGRQMGGHFATHSLNEVFLKDLTKQKKFKLTFLRTNA